LEALAEVLCFELGECRRRSFLDRDDVIKSCFPVIANWGRGYDPETKQETLEELIMSGPDNFVPV
jgi:hypothetical protein